MGVTFQYPSGPLSGRRRKNVAKGFYTFPKLEKNGKMHIRIRKKDLGKKRHQKIWYGGTGCTWRQVTDPSHRVAAAELLGTAQTAETQLLQATGKTLFLSSLDLNSLCGRGTNNTCLTHSHSTATVCDSTSSSKAGHKC